MSVVHVKMPDSVRIQAGARSDIQPTELDGNPLAAQAIF